MKKWLVIALSLLPVASYAFLCPSNFQQINLGDSLDKILSACGQPSSRTDTKQYSDSTPQEWIYFVSQTVASDTLQEQTGTLKTSFTFDKTGTAINISVNGIGVGETTICSGNTLSLGTSKDAVKAACGPPALTNGGNSTGNEQTVTTLTYNGNPPVSLIFEDGRLKSMK